MRDAILIETMSDPAEAAVGMRAAKSLSAIPAAVLYAFQRSAEGFRTMMGTSAAVAITASKGCKFSPVDILIRFVRG